MTWAECLNLQLLQNIPYDKKEKIWIDMSAKFKVASINMVGMGKKQCMYSNHIILIQTSSHLIGIYI